MDELSIRLLKPLGTGAFGEVHLAEVEQDGEIERCAVKILNEDAVAAGLGARHRDEARLLSFLDHESIVSVRELTTVEGRPALVMEYVDGVDARNLCRSQRFPMRAALEVTRVVAEALDAAYHAVDPTTGSPLQVIHRDIKPDNIMIAADGTVRVLDFGFALAEFDRESANTNKTLLGTKQYIAPEVWLLEKAGPGVDVFALGITLITLRRGRSISPLPLERDQFDVMVAKAIHSATKTLPHDLQRDVRDLLHSMLAYEPEERISALEVATLAAGLAKEAPDLSLVEFAGDAVPYVQNDLVEKTNPGPLFHAVGELPRIPHAPPEPPPPEPSPKGVGPAAVVGLIWGLVALGLASLLLFLFMFA